jgi:ABC-type molybdate transport system substrate-binding protein
MLKIALQVFAAFLALQAGLSGGAASVTEVRVLWSGAMRAVVQQLAPDFEKSTAGKVEEKVAADEAIDVAILTKPVPISWRAPPS